jgi:DNA-binding transcriptional LysR family regulator
MNLRQIEIFRTVMQTGSFTAAAAALHISQPGISRAARHLEIQLGVRLFERAQGRIQPTYEAVCLNAEIERSYRGVQSIQEYARNLKFGVYSTLRIAGGPMVTAEILPRAITAMLKANPGAMVSLDVLTRVQQMADALLSEHADVCVSSNPIDHPLVETQEVGHWELVCIYPQGHRFAQKSLLTPADFHKEPHVSYEIDTQQGKAMADWFLAAGSSAPAPRVRVRSGQIAAHLVAAGIGVGFVDNITAAAAASLGLRTVRLRKSQKFTLLALWNARFGASLQVSRFVDLVRHEMMELERRSRSPRR